MENTNFYNYSRNREKLLINLINIIEGLTCDSKIDERELVYLDTWLLESEAIKDNYFSQLIREKIAHILDDGIIEKSELDNFKSDLIEIQTKMLDIPDIDLYSIESDKLLLEGLCKGVVANQSLNDAEIGYLNWFLTSNGALKSNYPGKELYKLVKDILEDGVITEEERAQLMQALSSFSGVEMNSGIVDGNATRLPVQNIDSLEIKGATICLTGKFLCGSREKCKSDIESAGGVVVNRVSQSLDYLIIGALSSKDWRYQSYGRKIELAVEYRDIRKLPLKIISEEIWKYHQP
ncbi:BRCT domain-containing protein [Serratia quinivorans]|uniref:BRCT domain-containing protein n=1 Tax=Serratia quinivorans TaxID=137545 RepID=UPI00217804C4|nr:BRCT domain-containing protein [Serratia quinivorans]CAI0864920.1 NAD-dependent DNA ligase LigA [Serratia quinivorans]CAI0890859.1 NAD-dependent DNA ligase LigA [Serratia quinivorans]CAI1504297.1 NAD-dependent DNA ligase LigA [Serratia quinivorans]CAI2050136.1 NAD-dependent DNA ligase LigA [Serratia quinivorans]CAI2084343.1 NAD-dependent DNA ligase LigA [Serratia quinivorans]